MVHGAKLPQIQHGIKLCYIIIYANVSALHYLIMTRLQFTVQHTFHTHPIILGLADVVKQMV